MNGVRIVRDKEQSGKVLTDARKLYDQGKFAEARTMAYKASALHGAYAMWDMGDRPEKLIAEIDSAEAKGRKVKVPAVPGSKSADAAGMGPARGREDALVAFPPEAVVAAGITGWPRLGRGSFVRAANLRRIGPSLPSEGSLGDPVRADAEERVQIGGVDLSGGFPADPARERKGSRDARGPGARGLPVHRGMGRDGLCVAARQLLRHQDRARHGPQQRDQERGHEERPLVPASVMICGLFR